MSLKPTLREQRLKSIYKTSSKLSLPSKLRSDNHHLRTNHPSLLSGTNSNNPNLHIKLLSLANEDFVSSRRRISGLLSTRTTKKINLSMISPSNNTLHSTRSKHPDSFTFTQKRPLKYPMSPAVALESFRDWFNEIEQREILEYKHVYFLGIGANKVKPDMTKDNFGYDSKEGEYLVVVGDHLDYRFEVMAMIGKGSFGQVCRCLDHKTKEMVAVKIVKNKRKFHKQGAVEVKILKHMRDQDPEDCYNIVRVKGNFVFRSHLCIVFELLSMSLYDLVKQSNYKGLQMDVVCRIAVQLLVSLQYSHSLRIIHCDLKPENILLKTPNKCGIKIIDFGSGCYDSERIYTYIQSRFYRAPEIMLGIPYTQAIDMWSFGCILVELLIGYPLFPGEDEQEQFLRIVEVLGCPPASLIEDCGRKNVFFDSAGKLKIVPNSRGKLRQPGTRRFEDFFGQDYPLFIEFLQEVIQWHPELRPTAGEALNHPWILHSLKKKPSFVRKKRTMKSFLDLNEMTN